MDKQNHLFILSNQRHFNNEGCSLFVVGCTSRNGVDFVMVWVLADQVKK